MRLDARTKLLNPKWYEGMLNSGYEGVREIQKRLTNTVGWSATSGQVSSFVDIRSLQQYVNPGILSTQPGMGACPGAKLTLKSMWILW